MSQVSHEGVTLHYIEVGDKQNPPLIFLHGILVFTQSYSEFIERLAEKYFVIGIDMRGHGRSTIGTEPYSHKLLADDVILVADEIGLDKFYVVGHSAGGFALLSIAKLYSNRLIKGVSIASLYNHEGIDYDEKNDDYLTRKGFMDNRNNRNNYTLKIFDRAYEKIGEHEKFDSTKKVMVDYGTSMFPSYNKSDLRDIKTPILVIVAGDDNRIKPEHTIQMSRLIKNSKLEIIKGAPHFGILKRKKHLDIVIQQIINFIYNNKN
ncbi:MAG: alpha/beta hydrolase [Candidatus Neomarinimicrobiota bacterium]